MPIVLTIIIIIVAGLLVLKIFLRTTIIFEYQRGLKYVRGSFVRILGPGLHFYPRFFTTITKIDIRPSLVTVPGQELISSDGVNIKVSIAINFEITDPYAAINKVDSYQNALYLETQLAARDIIANAVIDEILEKRNEHSARLTELVTPKVQAFGIKINSINIKDLMFPGELKAVFAQVVKARKEGLAVLERTRGETAALRNLLNAAKILEENPLLVQLRAMQSSGNTFVFGMPPNVATALPKDNRPQT
jgi:regulator of protease activity HflC (stomatin/prohibitin superfamily)